MTTLKLTDAKDLTYREYQQHTGTTAVYPGKGDMFGLMYCALGAAGEAGEVANKVKKIFRDNDCIVTEEVRKKIIKEIGGVLWYLSQLSEELGTTLADAAHENVVELYGRRLRGTLHGDGDDR